MDLLVFDDGPGGLFVERVQATDITVNTNTFGDGSAVCNFNARLTISTSPRLIFFVANSRGADNSDRLDLIPTGGLEGKNVTDVMNGLYNVPLAATPDPDDIMPLIMWGKLHLNEISSQQPVVAERVKLLRSVAAVHVRATGLPTRALSDFSINAVSAGSAARTGLVAPPAIWKSWDNNDSATQTPDNVFPAPASVGNYFGNTTGTGYWAPVGELLYLYESTGADTYILIDANYLSRRYFYKIQLRNPVTGGPIDFVRNHRYSVNIINVKGPGYMTIQAAIGGPYSNEEVEIHVDAHDELLSFQSNGEDYLGLSCDEIFLIDGGEDIALDLAVAYTTRPTFRIEAFSGSGLTNPTVTYSTTTGLWTIRGTASGSGNGILTVTDGTFTHDIHITAKIPTRGNSPGGGNYGVEELVGSGGLISLGSIAPWYMEILPGSRNLFLNTTNNNGSTPLMAANAPGSNWGTWGLTSVSSETLVGNELYMFLSKTGAPSSGTIRGMYTNGDTIVNVHWVVNG
jgi:hypothetical protein